MLQARSVDGRDLLSPGLQRLPARARLAGTLASFLASMKIVMILFAALFGLAVSAVICLKYRIDNVRGEGNLQSSIDAEVIKAMKRGLFPSVVVGVYKDVVILTNQASATEMLGMMVMRQIRTQSWASSTPSDFGINGRPSPDAEFER
jgi:hypothetical protein